MYRPVLITAPATKPITSTEVKAQLDITYTDKDTYIDGLIAAATAHVDGWTGILGRCLITQTWRQDFDRFNRCLRLPLFPVASITSAKYEDEAGAEQTVDSANYVLRCDDLGHYVEFKDTYSFAGLYDVRPAVHVTYVAGEASADPAIKHALLILVRHWFDNPSAVAFGPAMKMPLAVDALLSPFRRVRF
jgi:uncharacterized phiE125 gp8 family phage protein